MSPQKGYELISWFNIVYWTFVNFIIFFKVKSKNRVEPLYAHTKRKLMTYTRRYINNGNNITLKNEGMFETFNWHNRNVR